MINDMILNSNECLNVFSDKKQTPGILPLLPYYSGILVNMNKIRCSRTFAERDIFLDTLHQYIGTLWNAIFTDDGLVKLISRPMIYISFNDDKTWKSMMAELVNVGLPHFYKSLKLPSKLQEYFLAETWQRTSGWIRN